MNIQRDDPRWTAYVLGELSDAERTEIDRELEASPEARELVDEIRMMTALLTDELAKQPAMTLQPEQRQAVLRAVPAIQSWWRRPRWIAAGIATAAVAAAIAIAILIPARNRMPPAPQADSAVLLPPPAEPPAGLDTGAVPAPLAENMPSKQERPQDTPHPAEPASPNGSEPVASKALTDATTAGGVTGLVGDASGAVIPGVEVTIINSEMSGGPKATVTDEQGRFQFPDLAEGQYTLAYNLPGFKSERKEVRVEDGRISTVAQHMEVASSSEEVTVTSQAPAIDKEAGNAIAGGRISAFAPSGAKDDAEKKKFAAPASPASGGAKPGVMGGVVGGTAARGAVALPPLAAFGRMNRPNFPNSNPGNYDRIIDNPFKTVEQEPLATFSIDVDTASYGNVRRFLNQNQLPPRDAVRIEELINYFNYDYAPPTGPHPIAVHSEVAAAPWNPAHRLVRIGVKAKDVDVRRRPPSNLVFLIDVSGSMMPPERLPLLKSGLRLLVEKLSENDRVSIVVYAGNSGLALPPTTGDRKEIIDQALDRLEAGGSTNGGAGIQLAYQIATANFVRGGINRVILCTDGDFNVGVTNQGDLTRLIEEKAKSGVFLSVLGVGTDNLKDSTMERLADRGNGNYAYLDSLNEARKVLVEQMGGTLMTVAKDVKIQVDFNPSQVSAYRLIGYEDRALAAQDFNDDSKDAGDMGAGQTVTALFEIVPPGGSVSGSGVDPSKYGTPAVRKPDSPPSPGGELLTVRVRYKQPDASDSTRFDVPLVDRETAFGAASADFQFASAVAEFGMILRDSPYRGHASLDHAIAVAERNRGADRNGYRAEFIGLVRRALQIKGRE